MNGRIECPIEKAFKEAGYIQVYDGQTAIATRMQKAEIPPGERRFFVRHYQQIKNGKVGKWHVKFIYDIRGRELVTFHIASTSQAKKEEQKMLSNFSMV